MTANFSESADRNTQPLLAVLSEYVSDGARILEIGAGTGQHSVAFSKALGNIEWQPSDRPGHLDDVQWRVEHEGGTNLNAPVALDLFEDNWPTGPWNMVMAVNVIHIAPWPATARLFQGASQALAPGGVVVLYGPYRYDDRPFEPGNASFDASLRAGNSGMGIRRFEDVRQCAQDSGFTLLEDREMPANNRTLIWSRQGHMAD